MRPIFPLSHSFKQCSTRSAGFFRSQLIRAHTVFNATCELVMINQNMKYRIVLNLYINLYLSKDKQIEIFNLSLLKRDQVGQVGHGISTALHLIFHLNLACDFALGHTVYISDLCSAFAIHLLSMMPSA